jgi:uncharacterized protein (DUF983 family)
MSAMHNTMQSLLATPAMQTPFMRGLRGRCPKCGEGKLFHAFLKVSDNCPACGEALHHHRADDFPAYLVIVIVGHIVVAATLVVEVTFAPPLWLHAVIWLPVTTAMALALLQPVKGAVVAFQWEHGMEGFAAAKQLRETSMASAAI